MAVLLVRDVNSAILSHLSPANDITKNCTNGLPCLIIFLLSSPRLICRALFGQAALGTRRLLSLLSGFDAGIRINLGYFWQSCIALRRSLQGLVGRQPPLRAWSWAGPFAHVRVCGDSDFQGHLHLRNTVPSQIIPYLAIVGISFVGSKAVLFSRRPCLAGWGESHL